MEQLLICYHGTTRQNATRIKKEGFKPYTYFGKHLEEAVFYGGDYIFEVVFPISSLSKYFLEPDSFQFRLKDWYSPEHIVGHYRLKLTRFYDNVGLREKVLESNSKAEDA